MKQPGQSCSMAFDRQIFEFDPYFCLQSGLSQLQQPAANLPGEGDRGAREAKFLAAVKLASSSKSAGHPIVFVTVVDGNAARYHLPLFLASLKSAGRLDQHVIVATLDTWAQSVCEKVCTCHVSHQYKITSHRYNEAIVDSGCLYCLPTWVEDVLNLFVNLKTLSMYSFA